MVGGSHLDAVACTLSSSADLTQSIVLQLDSVFLMSLSVKPAKLEYFLFTKMTNNAAHATTQLITIMVIIIKCRQFYSVFFLYALSSKKVSLKI